MTWRSQLVYDASSYPHRHSLRGARATCAGRLTSWLERCTDSPGPRALVLRPGDEPLGRSLVAALLDASAVVAPEHAPFVRDARALLPPGPWKERRDGVEWEGARRLRSEPATIPAGPTHAHLLHLVALLDAARAELGVEAAYEFLLREPDGDVLDGQDPASIHPKAPLFSTAALELQPAGGAASPLELELNFPLAEVGPDLVRQWDAAVEDLGKLSPDRLARREVKPNGKDLTRYGVHFDRTDFPEAPPAKKRKLALPPPPGPVRADAPLDYRVGIRRARPVTDAERVGIARMLATLPRREDAGAPRIWLPYDDATGILGVFTGTAAPGDLGPVVALAGALREVLGDFELVVDPSAGVLATPLDARVEEASYDFRELSTVTPVEGGPNLPAALAAAVEAAATGRPFSGVGEAGIRRLFGVLPKYDVWSVGAARVLAASDPVEVAVIGLPRLLKAGSGAGEAVSAAIARAADLEPVAEVFRTLWDEPKTKYTWGDLKAALSEAAIDRLVAHPPLRAWLLRQLEARAGDEMGYRRVSSTAELLQRATGPDVSLALARALRRLRHEPRDTWGGMARAVLLDVLGPRAADRDALVSPLVRELARKPVYEHDLDAVERTAARLVDVAGDAALPWLDRVLSSRPAAKVVVPALIRLKSAASTERLVAIAREPNEGLRSAALAELAARGVAAPDGLPATDAYEVYGRPPFTAELPPALDRWWQLTPKEAAALDGSEQESLSSTGGPARRTGRVTVTVVSDLDAGAAELRRLAELVGAAAAEQGWALPLTVEGRALTMEVSGTVEVLEAIVARVGVAVLRASLEVPDWTLQVEDDVEIVLQPWGVQAGDVGTGTISGLIPEESVRQRFLALARRRADWAGVVARGGLAGAWVGEG